jgi:hypothetical protein
MKACVEKIQTRYYVRRRKYVSSIYELTLIKTSIPNCGLDLECAMNASFFFLFGVIIFLCMYCQFFAMDCQFYYLILLIYRLLSKIFIPSIKFIKSNGQSVTCAAHAILSISISLLPSLWTVKIRLYPSFASSNT